jgi:hypothetical protein
VVGKLFLEMGGVRLGVGNRAAGEGRTTAHRFHAPTLSSPLPPAKRNPAHHRERRARARVRSAHRGGGFGGVGAERRVGRGGGELNPRYLTLGDADLSRWVYR